LLFIVVNKNINTKHLIFLRLLLFVHVNHMKTKSSKTKYVIYMTLVVMFFVSIYFIAFAKKNNVSDTPIIYDSMSYNDFMLESNLSNQDIMNIINGYVEDTVVINEEEQNIIDEIKDVTEKQNYSKEQTNNKLYQIKNKSKAFSFLVGNKLGILRFQLVQVKDQVSRLKDLKEKVNNNIERLQIEDKLKLAEMERIILENTILEQQNRFSLFGWVANYL